MLRNVPKQLEQQQQHQKLRKENSKNPERESDAWIPNH